MSKEFYSLQPLAVEVHPVSTGTDIILRRDIKECTLTNTVTDDDGNSVEQESTAFSCEEMQYRYRGEVTADDVAAKFDYWWDIASGKTHDFEDLVQQADHIIFGLYPTALLEWFKAYGPLLKPGCIFTDVSGVKTGLVEPVQAMCPAGVEFIASHPMAGRETSSVEHAAEVNFAPANFIVTPTEKNTPEAVQWAKELAEVLGFKHICTLTVQEHDRMIGYVSQLCHAIAVSLMCANDNTSLCEYTGDSFRDLTRIARINDKMWAELFLWNKENLISEIDQFSGALNEMRNALVADDREKLEEMFRLSTQRRAAFDKKAP